MSDDARIQQLLQDALDSDRTPEEACAAAPDLLDEVRRRWENCRLIEADLNALFPSLPKSDAPEPASPADGNFPDIPGYEVESILGRGGMGIVYKARHIKLRRPVAVKMMLFGHYASGTEVMRFLQEARTVAALRHPNVVQVYDVGECGGLPYFTMELLEGGSLAERLGGAPQPPPRAAALVATLADAVDAAHHAGIVHRDLKPANVLLTADGLPKIGDFGLARTAAGDDPRLTVSGQRVGTRCYMAPEQASPRFGQVGPASDVYALGAMLYEMLTGRPPFFGDSPTETERQLLFEDPVPPSRLNRRVPRDLETICLTSLRKDPGRRYSSASALAADVGRFQRGEPITARRVGRLERAAKWVRRRPAAAAALAGGLLVLVGLGGGGAWLLSQRAATARLVEEDLRYVGQFERRSDWAQAATALERAKARLGVGGPAVLRARIAAGDRDLALVARLDDIPLERASRTLLVTNLIESYQGYAAAFRNAGLGTFGDDPSVVGARIRTQDIRPVLVAALDDWATCTNVLEERRWLMAVAQHAEGNPTDWRACARDPNIWDNKAALTDVCAVVSRDPSLAQAAPATPGTSASASLLVALGIRLKTCAGDRAAIPFLERVQRAYPSDFWANFTLGQALRQQERYAEAEQYLQAAVATRPDAAIAQIYLGEALAMDYQMDAAFERFRQAARTNPTWFRPPLDIATTFGRMGRSEDAVVAYHEALRLAPGPEVLQKLPGLAPEVAVVHRGLGYTLERLGKTAEAIEHYRQGVALDPKNRFLGLRLSSAYLTAGRQEEALTAWRHALGAEPGGEHADWQGYAELALYLGHVDEYRRARQALLNRFGAAAQPNICERTARTCLLLPGSEEELQRATDLIDRALANVGHATLGAKPYFLFAKALSEYRHGRWASTVAMLQGEGGSVLHPGPSLLRAMAQHRLGQTARAMSTLASAALEFDWGGEPSKSAESWMFHALRREAEGMILPDLPAFLAGKYRPRGSDEAIGMTAACQAGRLYVARARLWWDVQADHPNLAGDCRESLVGAAALAGSEAGADTESLTDADRARWRARARDGIRAELAAADTTLKQGPSGKARLLERLTNWSTSHELAGVRGAPRLDQLPAAERAEWVALWSDVNTQLERVRAMK